MFDGAIGGFRYPDDVIIIGGTGNDTIINEYGKKVLFQYAKGEGNDYIKGFNETSTLSIGGGSYSTKKSGDDLIVTVGDGKITLWSAASLSAVNIKGVTKTDSTILTITNNTSSTVKVRSTVKVIDASARTTAVKITANSLANSILGGTGNYSVWGGTGNDSLWGDAGNDMFFYAKGDGKDVIFGFEDGDTLTLDGLDFTSSYSKSKGTVTLTFDSGSITFKEFTAKTFHIDNDTYQISGSKLKKQ